MRDSKELDIALVECQILVTLLVSCQIIWSRWAIFMQSIDKDSCMPC